jgi:hypothetical protein
MGSVVMGTVIRMFFLRLSFRRLPLRLMKADERKVEDRLVQSFFPVPYLRLQLTVTLSATTALSFRQLHRRLFIVLKRAKKRKTTCCRIFRGGCVL